MVRASPVIGRLLARRSLAGPVDLAPGDEGHELVVGQREAEDAVLLRQGACVVVAVLHVRGVLHVQIRSYSSISTVSFVYIV